MAWSKRKLKKYQKEYHKFYYKAKKNILKEYSRIWYKRHHITIDDKRQCYATGNYEEAIEKLKKEKGLI